MKERKYGPSEMYDNRQIVLNDYDSARRANNRAFRKKMNQWQPQNTYFQTKKKML